MLDWLILTATLPTSPSGLRVRIWRTLKATHCATLREGVYILPASAATAKDFWSMDAAIRDAGAQSHLLALRARDEPQEAGFRALFDRADLYADFTQSLKDARKALQSATESDIRKTLRSLDLALQRIAAMDFFPSKSSEPARSGLQALRLEAERRLSPGEPAPTFGDVPRLSCADYQGKTWATRARPWIDRLATAWLVHRFIDKQPTFIWLTNAAKCPKHALGYDFDGATFTHVGERVTFEVVASSFALDTDPGVKGISELVHAIDVGGLPADEAAGLALIVQGLQVQHQDDDALLLASMPIFDALYAAMQITQ